MQKVQVMLEDKMAEAIANTAHEMGLSVSAYTRMLVMRAYKPNNAKRLEDILVEPSEEISLDDFKANLRALKKNA